MKAVLICPFTRKITDIEIEPGLAAMYEALSHESHPVQMVEVVACGQGDIWVDEEGLFKDSMGWFTLPHHPHPIAGRGLVLGHDGEGNSTDTPFDAATVSQIVSFVLRLA